MQSVCLKFWASSSVSRKNVKKDKVTKCQALNSIWEINSWLKWKKSVYLLTEKELHLDFNSLDERKSPEETAWKDFTSSAECCMNVYAALKMTSKVLQK